jgi:hypothetical protein
MDIQSSNPHSQASLPLADLMNVNQTAKVLGISPKTLRDHVLHRTIEHIKLQGRVLFHPDTIVDLIRRSTVPAKRPRKRTKKAKDTKRALLKSKRSDSESESQ